MPREFSRGDRVAAQLQRELADLLRNELKDPRIGWVTVHAVEVSRDLAVAKVFLGFLEEGDATRESLAALKHSAPFLRRELGRRMKMRVVPELRFVRDESFERGMRISQLLHEIQQAEEPPAAGDDEPGVRP
ncbi:MAG TPA: 30S ribosome-binding factor RbfA [Methylococcaceae bacterium]|nr:30S ribosome-binding factor RbfA [Methylococcaceae bacterium]